MGGIHVNTDSETTLPHLFAVGETACNGVHGRNRLASNSLLESIVFARRAADKIMHDRFAVDAAEQLEDVTREFNHVFSRSTSVPDLATIAGINR